MRAAISFAIAALFLVATAVSVDARGRGGPSYPHFPPIHHPPHHPRPPHHPPPVICKIVIIKIPKITYVSFGRHRHPRITYIVIKKVICFPPVSRW